MLTHTCTVMLCFAETKGTENFRWFYFTAQLAINLPLSSTSSQEITDGKYITSVALTTRGRKISRNRYSLYGSGGVDPNGGNHSPLLCASLIWCVPQATNSIQGSRAGHIRLNPGNFLWTSHTTATKKIRRLDEWNIGRLSSFLAA